MQMTPRKEAFCRYVVEIGNASEAYRRSYNAKNMKERTIWKRASELMACGMVKGRIAEIRQQLVESTKYTVQAAMEEALEAYQVAKKKGNGGAMVAATTLRAKLNGLLVDRAEVGKPGEFESLTDDELEQSITESQRTLARTENQIPTSVTGKAATAGLH